MTYTLTACARRAGLSAVPECDCPGPTASMAHRGGPRLQQRGPSSLFGPGATGRSTARSQSWRPSRGRADARCMKYCGACRALIASQVSKANLTRHYLTKVRAPSTCGSLRLARPTWLARAALLVRPRSWANRPTGRSRADIVSRSRPLTPT